MDLMVVLGTTMINTVYPKEWATLHFSQNKSVQLRCTGGVVVVGFC